LIRVRRCLPVPGNLILSSPRHRLLSDPVLHPEPARRDSVLGVVLDQRRRESGSGLHRPADRVTSQLDHPPRDGTGPPTSSVIGLLTVLTSSTQSTGINTTLPRVNYVKAIDVWMSACLVFVFAALVEYAMVNVYARRRLAQQLGPPLALPLMPLAATAAATSTTTVSAVPPRALGSSTREVPPVTEAPSRRPRLLPGIASLLPGLDVACLEQVNCRRRSHFRRFIFHFPNCRQCFDAVGLVTGRISSGLYKFSHQPASPKVFFSGRPSGTRPNLD